MKTNWQTKKLGEICDFQNGFAFKSSFFKLKGLPILRISNIQKDTISYNRLVFFNKNDYKEDLSKYRVFKNDLIIAMSGATTGKLAVVDKDDELYLNQRVGKFKPKKDLNNEYLYYFLSTKIEENLKKSLGVAQPNLSTEQIKNINIPLPPLPEQKRIVKILDEVFEKLEKVKEGAEKNLANVKELFESYLQNIFANKEKDWEEKKLKEIESISFLRGNGLNKSLLDDNGKFECILYGELYTKYTNPIIKKVISKTNFNGKIKSKKGDVLVPGTTTADAYGIAIARSLNIENIILGGDINILRTNNEEILSDYLSYFLNGPAKNELASYATGTNIMHLSNKKIENISISISSLTEQKEIVKKLDELSRETKKLENIYKEKLKDIEELKKSILQKAFTGNL